MKSSFSEPKENCVDVVHTEDGTEVRDTKLPESPVLRFTHDEWSAFLLGVHAGEFDRPRPTTA